MAAGMVRGGLASNQQLEEQEKRQAVYTLERCEEMGVKGSRDGLPILSLPCQWLEFAVS